PGTAEGHAAAPALVDGAFQAALPLLSARGDRPVAYLPTAVRRVRLWRPLPENGLIHVRLASAHGAEAVFDASLTGPDGAVVMELLGCRARRYAPAGASGQPEQYVEVRRAAPLPGTPERPAPLPAPQTVLSACGEDLADMVEEHRRLPYAELRQRWLELIGHFAAAMVTELRPGRADFTVDELLESGVKATYEPFLRTVLPLAEAHGLLTRTGRRWRLADTPAPAQRFQSLSRRFPTAGLELYVTGVCGRHYASVLRGDADPFELLLSEPENLAARMYDSSITMRFQNRAARRLVGAAAADWPEDRPLRVLEVGAGTGGLTGELLPGLPADRAHYTYTDISPAFFPAAQRRFAAFDFVDYRCLDLDRDPAEQGFVPGSYDLVVASHALHTTRDLEQALGRVAQLLTDQGHLLILESHAQATVGATFGLLETFWGNTDTELRPDGSLLPHGAWPELLHRCGFAGTVRVGGDQQPFDGDYPVLLTARSSAAPSAPAAALGRDERREADILPQRRWLVARLPGIGDATGPHGLTAALETALADAAAGTEVRALAAGQNTEQWAELFTARPEPLGVVLVVESGGADDPEQATEGDLRRDAALRAVARACDQAEATTEISVWLVVADGPRAHCPPTGPGAALWGAVRTWANERPGLAVRRIALAHDGAMADPNPALVEHVVRELRGGSAEDEVLLTPHGRFVTRLRRLEPAVDTAGSGSFTLALENTGPRYRLHWRHARLTAPGPGEVIVAVRAAALNYRDVMIAMGLVPPAPGGPRDDGDRAPLGLDCAGVVTAVGPGVTRLAPGDRVLGAVEGCFGTHVRGRETAFAALPADMSYVEGATVPTAFLTVRHALHHLARLSPGETVLIHAAAGGVGLAALQHAQHIGARVIATAGSPMKRELLRLLGVEHVLHSRSLHFADQVADLTDGRGVDVVLNSLAGEPMRRSLELLRPGGRFVELGKRDFLADTPLPLAAFAHNLAFFGMDLAPYLSAPDASPVLAEHWEAVDAGLRDGTYRPLPPRVFSAARIGDAFACLQHSRHTGKVVVTFGETVPVRAQATAPALDPQAEYLITGGLGGFGAATARHLAARGARRLTLLGRRGADSPEAPALLAELRERGVRVTVHAADVADPKALSRVFDDLDATGRRLAGVVHAAMVPDEGHQLSATTDDHVRAVVTPKVTGGRLLHAHTRRRDLDFFVLYSSVAATIGNVRQAPYSAANAALDALARDRRRAGLPALSVQWGTIGDAGYVERTGRGDELSLLGLSGMSAEQALLRLDGLLQRPDVTTAVVADIQWDDALRWLHTLTAPRTATLLSPRHSPDEDDDLSRALATAGADEAARLVERVLQEALAHVMGAVPERIDRERRFHELGVDSLMSAELATTLNRRIRCDISAIELTGTDSIRTLALRILARRERADGLAPRT
ncbi:SDR family NAD(P)-dependent oxidoreductase, partial [Streptomyces spectabilis]|uniref:SDR family NAD(P)-dependent oxidoreductase n=1 Tax=Streptomyces spectabilis TaxID=68270 RepID=UPI0033E599EF